MDLLHPEIRKIIELTEAGATPVCRYKVTPEIAHFEKGMMFRCLSATFDSKHGNELVYKLTVTQRDFVNYNKFLESPIYYDEDNVACLTFSQYYPEKTEREVYLYIGTGSEQEIELVNDENNFLVQKFIESGAKNYVSWLEDLVKAYMAWLEELALTTLTR